MLKEFAVEPEVFGDWREFCFLHEKFGIHKARTIARFPKKWARMVYDSTNDFTDIQKKTVEQWLSEKDSFLIPGARIYDTACDWLQNAEKSHIADPLHAIVARSNPRNKPNVITGASTGGGAVFWNCPCECIMPKTIDGFVHVSRDLLKISERVIFVDPFFWKANSNSERRERWGEPLKALLQHISSAINPMIQFCMSASPKGETVEFRQNELESSLPAFIPVGQAIEIVLLQGAPGQDTHNRYILTERGGLKFPWGLDARQDGSKDTVNLMAQETHSAKFKEYSEPENSGHSVVARFTVSGATK